MISYHVWTLSLSPDLISGFGGLVHPKKLVLSYLILDDLIREPSGYETKSGPVSAQIWLHVYPLKIKVTCCNPLVSVSLYILSRVNQANKYRDLWANTNHRRAKLRVEL
jgi:hypothetical protein